MGTISIYYGYCGYYRYYWYCSLGLGTVQFNANLTPVGKQPPRGLGFLPAPAGVCTGTHASHKLPNTSYKDY